MPKSKVESVSVSTHQGSALSLLLCVLVICTLTMLPEHLTTKLIFSKFPESGMVNDEILSGRRPPDIYLTLRVQQ